MDKKTDLARWLEEMPDEDKRAAPKSAPPADIYAEAVAKGLAAQASLQCGKNEPKWLELWVAKLTPADVQTIRARQDEERAILQEDVEMLLGGDMEKWTEAERSHSETVGRRLAAANLVLQAWEKARGTGQTATTFLPMEATTAATAAA
ncbi:MAG: hypothetical protein ABII19_03420 [Patescibacteria group bacterium]